MRPIMQIYESEKELYIAERKYTYTLYLSPSLSALLSSFLVDLYSGSWLLPSSEGT